jgi:hypothetical protein
MHSRLRAVAATDQVRPFRVDSVVPAMGQAYLSASTISAGDGCFTLLVFRMNRFQQPVMRFPPLGETLIRTVVPAVFHPLPTPGPLHRLLAWT